MARMTRAERRAEREEAKAEAERIDRDIARHSKRDWRDSDGRSVSAGNQRGGATFFSEFFNG